MQPLTDDQTRRMARCERLKVRIRFLDKRIAELEEMEVAIRRVKTDMSMERETLVDRGFPWWWPEKEPCSLWGADWTL